MLWGHERKYFLLMAKIFTDCENWISRSENQLVVVLGIGAHPHFFSTKTFLINNRQHLIHLTVIKPQLPHLGITPSNTANINPHLTWYINVIKFYDIWIHSKKKCEIRHAVIDLYMYIWSQKKSFNYIYYCLRLLAFDTGIFVLEKEKSVNNPDNIIKGNQTFGRLEQLQSMFQPNWINNMKAGHPSVQIRCNSLIIPSRPSEIGFDDKMSGIIHKLW